jgi:hypothetical protein
MQHWSRFSKSDFIPIQDDSENVGLPWTQSRLLIDNGSGLKRRLKFDTVWCNPLR